MFQRELLILGRSWTTWGLRVFVTLAALALAAAVGLFYQLSRGLRIAAGPMVFSALFYTLMLFCLIEGLRTTALGFPEERREGTLGLLFLTPLSSFDVLVGKLSGAALTAVYGLLATVPVLFIPVLLGGLTGGEVFRSFIVLIGALGLSLASGTVASTNTRDGLGSLVRATICLFMLLSAPLGAKLLLNFGMGVTLRSTLPVLGAASPVLAMTLIDTAGTPGKLMTFWLGQLGTWLIIIGLLLVAARRLRKTWRQERANTELPSTSGLAFDLSSPSRQRKTPQAFLAAVIARRTSNRQWLWVVAGLTLLPNLRALFIGTGGSLKLFSVLFLPLAVVSLAVQLVIIYIACRTFAEARQTGEMEILLTTPVADRELVRSLALSLRPFALWPTVVVAVIYVFGLVGQFLTSDPQSQISPFYPQLGVTASIALGTVVSTYLQSSALIWVGLWKGLTSKNSTSAVTWTFLMVVILTYVAIMIVGLGMSLGLNFILAFRGQFLALNNSPWSQFFQGFLMNSVSFIFLILAYLGWMRWARQNLYTRFRQAAAQAEANSAGLRWFDPGLRQ